jgi:hypothetical protein
MLSSPVHSAETGGEDGGYEIDYEEEAEGEAAPEGTPEPLKKKGPGKKASPGGGGPAVQGSRAKNRFAPILKSETKSVYKKDGKALDVDTD